MFSRRFNKIDEKPRSQNEEIFYGQVRELLGRLNDANIELRVLGSIGATALLASTDDVKELDYDRPYFLSPDKQFPDVDLLIPREDISEAWAIRRHMLKQAHPIKAGLAIGFTAIDFYPDRPVSKLLAAGISYDIDSSLLDSNYVNYNGVYIPTLDPLVLANTYGLIGGCIRPKDVSSIRSLTKLALTTSGYSQEDMKPFKCMRSRSMSRRSGLRCRTIDSLTGLAISHVPTKLTDVMAQNVLTGRTEK